MPRVPSKKTGGVETALPIMRKPAHLFSDIPSITSVK
jgi:hypothetical protein